MASGDRWFFGRVARVYDLVMPAADPEPLRQGLAMAEGPVDRLVDLGGGSGRAARAIDVPERIVIDATPAMLQQVPPGLERLLASATDLPVADGGVDAVLIVDALHHLPDPGRVFAEVLRSLRPGGVLVVRDFNPATLRGRLLAMAEHAIRLDSTFYSPGEVRDRLAAAGFEAGAVLESGFACTVVGRKPGRT